MRTPLTLAAAQPACRPLDIAANVSEHARIVRLAAARVVVFPELSLTGYELDAPELALDDSRLSPLVEACAETGSLALVGAPVPGNDSGRPSIATLAISASGAKVAYRKIWLGEAEAERFGPGTAPKVIEIDGWRLGLAICRDTAFPEHAAETAELAMDLYVASTVKHAHEAELQEQRAQRVAQCHGVWVAVASAAGLAGGEYADAAGGSGVWKPGGDVSSQAGAEPGAFARATLG